MRAHTLPASSFVLNNVMPWTVTIISVLKASYLSGQISAGCGTRGEDGWGTCIEDGGGEGICPESQRGIYAIVQYYPAHVTKGGRVGQRELLVSRERDERYEKRKQETERRRKHEVAKGCKQMTRCDRQAKQVTKITVNTHKRQMLQK